MSTLPNPPEEGRPRDAIFWAQKVSALKVVHAPGGALNLNVEGRRVVGPLQGFGPLWQKTYWLSLHGSAVQPKEVIKRWREHFPEFWPVGNHFYGPLVGIAPGEVALLNVSLLGGMTLSTGVLVLYADEESFTLMTPQGHIFAGWITFSAYEEGGNTLVQAQVLMRANDPLYEIGLRLGGHKQEDTFWEYTLKALAADFHVKEAVVETHVICLDRRVQWTQARNIWHNAALRTLIYKMAAPIRWMHTRKRRRDG